MEMLNIIGSICSILGFLIAIFIVRKIVHIENSIKIYNKIQGNGNISAGGNITAGKSIKISNDNV
ncbi:MAG: hypothetical protein AABY47_08050 [Pseudomonadota bacterium]